MFTHFLAVVIMSALADQPPNIVGRYTSPSECLVVAAKQNATNPDVINADPLLGLRFVCLSLVQPDSI